MSERSHTYLVWLFPVVFLSFAGFSRGQVTARGVVQSPSEAPPEALVFASPIGKVTFPHALHVNELGAACTYCHHPAATAPLNTPHSQWLPKAGHQCLACHKKRDSTGEHYACTDCHSQPAPARERVIPSRKVAIHLTCGRCHEIGRGQDASKACVNCHAGEKAPW